MNESKLTQKQQHELVDTLRRNFLYQTPELLNPQGDGKEFVRLKMHAGCWQRMMDLIEEAGGWDLDPKDRHEILSRHVEAFAEALQAGGLVDLSEVDVGEILMLLEVARSRDQQPVVQHCLDELNRRAKQEN